MEHVQEGLTLEVHLLTEPCLWCWEIRDRDGRLVESSWADAWVGFASRSEAAGAGARRLAEMATARA